MAKESKFDAINGDRMATEFACGDAKYGRSISSPSRRHMGDDYRMDPQPSRVFFL